MSFSLYSLEMRVKSRVFMCLCVGGMGEGGKKRRGGGERKGPRMRAVHNTNTFAFN